MKILLDENIPESLVVALEDLGHEVDSVNHLKLKGLDNGTLYRQVAVQYDLCFTRDAGFAHNVRQMRDPSQVKVLRVIVPQQRTESFVPAFVDAFQKSDWSRYSNGDDWRPSSKDIWSLVEKHWKVSQPSCRGGPGFVEKLKSTPKRSSSERRIISGHLRQTLPGNGGGIGKNELE